MRPSRTIRNNRRQEVKHYRKGWKEVDDKAFIHGRQLIRVIEIHLDKAGGQMFPERRDALLIRPAEDFRHEPILKTVAVVLDIAKSAC